MRVFLTGATGYVGGAVARALYARGHEVVVLVRNLADAPRLRELGYTPVIGDMCQPGAWTQEASTSDAIVHAAQIRMGKRVSAGWVRAAEAADGAAVRALIAAAERGGRCKTFLYTSGVTAFGDHGDDWADETSARRRGVIGQYHANGERLALAAKLKGIPVAVLRPGLPYAPGGTFATFFLADAMRGKFNFVGTGENFFPCEHLDDVGDAYALAVERPPVGEVIAIVDDEPLRVRDLGRLLLAEFGGGEPKGAPRWLVSLFAGAPLAEMLGESFRVKNDRAKRLLGWKPTHPSIKEGLPAVVAQYRNQVASRASVRER